MHDYLDLKMNTFYNWMLKYYIHIIWRNKTSDGSMLKKYDYLKYNLKNHINKSMKIKNKTILNFIFEKWKFRSKYLIIETKCK